MSIFYHLAGFSFKKEENKIIKKENITEVSALPQVRLKSEVPLVKKVQSVESIGINNDLNLDNSDLKSEFMCLLLGPYEDVITARSQSLVLSNQDIEAKLVERVDEIISLYWVYITPSESKDAGIKRLAALQEAGIYSYIVAEGEWKNAISLGFFSSSTAVDKIIQERRQAGDNVAKIVRQKEIKSIWLALGHDDLGKISSEVFESMKKENLLLKKEEKGCNSVALLSVIN